MSLLDWDRMWAMCQCCQYPARRLGGRWPSFHFSSVHNLEADELLQHISA
jgi:hypothetical protein